MKMPSIRFLIRLRIALFANGIVGIRAPNADHHYSPWCGAWKEGETLNLKE